MASHKISIHKRGFTLLEIIVVMALIVIITGFGLIVNFDDYRGYSFRNERDTVAGVLQKARSQAVNNMCFGAGCTDGKPHGVYFGIPGQYVIFQGASYATRDVAVDEIIESENNTSSIAGMQSVVFSRLSGDASVSPANTPLTLIDGANHTSVFTIEPEGRIWWSN